MNRWVLLPDAGYCNSQSIIDSIEGDPELADLLDATARKLPKSVPDPLPEPDITAYEETAAAHDAELDQEHARRLLLQSCESSTVSSLLREAAELLSMLLPRVGQLKLAWQAAECPRRRATTRTPRPAETASLTTSASSQPSTEMEIRLTKPAGRSFYRQRQAVIEPVFGQTLIRNWLMTLFLRCGHDKVAKPTPKPDPVSTGHNLTILDRNDT